MARFLVYPTKIKEQYFKLKEISDIISYSYKTNPFIGKLMKELLDNEIDNKKLFFSINSKYSINRFSDKDNLIFFLQGENETELIDIFNKTDYFVVDNKNDLDKIIKVAKAVGKKINLFLRVKIREHTVYTGKYFVYGFSKEEAKKLLIKLANLKGEVIKSLGVHFHRKTQNIGEWYLREEFSQIFDGHLDLIDYVNIGGGIPWKYINSNPDITYIFNKIRNFKYFLNNNNIKLIIEPGRFIAAPSVDLEVDIINKYSNVLVVNASIFNAYLDTYLFNIRLPVEGELSKEEFNKLSPDEKRKYKEFLIKGYSPDSLDIFRYKVILRNDLEIGDKLIFKNAGAYNFHCDFNDLPVIENYIVDDQ